MGIFQTYLEEELALAKKIFIYYTDKLVYYSGIGSNKYHRWYVDSLQLYTLVKFIENINIEDGVSYIGANEISTDVILNIFHKVREYYRSDIDTTYELNEITSSDITTYVLPYTADWKLLPISITSDRPSSLNIGVNLEELADMQSIQVVVNGMSDPNYTTDVSKNGYHIVSNTLYWHNYYDLLTSDTVQIQYLQIKG